MAKAPPLAALPCLGVGASLSLDLPPDPAALVRRVGGPRFIEYTGKVSFSAVEHDVARIREAGAAVLFHPSYINFCGTFPNSNEWLAATDHQLSATGAPWFAQDCAYCFWASSAGYSSQLGYFLPPIFNEASLERAVERVKEVQAKVRVPVAIEPPPLTFVVGRMPMMTFLAKLAERADCALLLDAGHLVSYEMAAKRHIADELAGFPFERVIELHVAGGRIERAGDEAVYVDAHHQAIQPAAWQMFEWLLPRLPGLKAVCFECEGADAEHVMSTLGKVRMSVIALSANAELRRLVEDDRRGA